MKPLPSQNRLNDLLAYDQFTGELRWRSRPLRVFPSARACSTWNARYAGKAAFTTKTTKGYHVGSIEGELFRANRVIYKMMTGIDPIQVDHEDGDNQNDRWVNLREVTSQQNQMNMKKASNNTSGTTGVSWNSSKKRWEAKIKVNQKTIHLGRFINKDNAIVVRQLAEAQYGFHPNHGR